MFNKTKIKSIHAREILDSRGDPTVEVEVVLKDGSAGIAGVPSGASTGAHEALELRDGDKSRYGGKGVLKACANVNGILAAGLIGKDAADQESIDSLILDINGVLGANADLGVSIACLKAAAKSRNLEIFEYIQQTFEFPKSYSGFGILDSGFPIPMFNILNGGKHADSGLDIQEFMIAPKSGESFEEKLRMGSEIFHSLGKVLEDCGLSTGVGNEGGYAPRLKSHDQAFAAIIEAGEKAGYKNGDDFRIAIDAAASSFYKNENEKYILSLENKEISSTDLIKIYAEWAAKYRIFSIEDGLEEEDFEGWKIMKEILGDKQIVADDLTVTNSARLEMAIKKGAANAIIIKPNQIGTISETIACARKARNAKWNIIVSHRSGETGDDFIADLAFGIGAEYIKSGASSRGERVSKYNRLLKIELLCKNKE